MLLDTEVFIWASMQPEKLSRTALKVCESASYQLLVSIASIWEILIKTQKGKLLIDNPRDWFNINVQRLNATVVPIRLRDVYAMANLPELHRDPFDRMIMAQTVTDRIPLISCDRMIRQYPIFACVW